MKNKNKLILIIGVVLIIFLLIYLFIPFFKLKGKREITLEVNNEYKENGYLTNAKVLEVSNNINTSKLGTYTVLYKYKKYNKIKETIRVVNIVDKTPPELDLIGNLEINNCSKSYQEEGYAAFDNYDGDLTQKVEKEIKDGKIIYKVKDSSNNITTKERIFSNIDKEDPIIKLKGSSVNLKINNKYVEQGYTVTDNCDDDLTSKVEITNNININKEGTYEVIYKVKDKSGNESKEVRKVTVYTPKKCFSSVSNGKPGVIYLTFDDGPSTKNTARLLDILKEENVKATFFLTDKTNTDYLIKRMYDEGHTIGLHTASHNYKYIYSSTTNFIKDIEKIQEKVARITGEKSSIIRFPGGSSNTVSSFNPGIMCTLSNMVIEKGYHYFDWNVSSGDAGSKRSKKNTYRNVTNNLSKNRANVVLMHDIYDSTVDAVKDIIKYGKDNGYTFEKITMDTEMYTHYVNN
ncbi:MAG TPA: polysaccharide deacetylase family protein [Bacilli bacterium]|nr:polysaccharide deacetylase family protein [Bacilli bacterium]